MPAFLCAPGLDLDGLLALCVLEQAQSGTDDFTGVVVAAAAIDATTQRLRRPARSDDRLAAKRAHPHDLDRALALRCRLVRLRKGVVLIVAALQLLQLAGDGSKLRSE